MMMRNRRAGSKLQRAHRQWQLWQRAADEALLRIAELGDAFEDGKISENDYYRRMTELAEKLRRWTKHEKRWNKIRSSLREVEAARAPHERVDLGPELVSGDVAWPPFRRILRRLARSA